MRRPIAVSRFRLLPALGLLTLAGAATVVVVLGNAAIAQRPNALPASVFEATHLPPLLVLRGEEVRLTFDVHCAARGVEDPESPCLVSGSAFLRASRDEAFRPMRLRRTTENGIHQLSAVVPGEALSASSDGLEYYVELEADGGGDRVVLPPGGAEAPYTARQLVEPVQVDLGTHSFGRTVRGTRVARARWGDGPHDVGLEPGRILPPSGASTFDVDRTGAVSILDQAHHRLLRWSRRNAAPTRVPLSVEGRLADMTITDDGSVYVLESTAPPGQSPLVRRFDDTGRELDVVATAERTPAQIRTGPDGPLVLQHPSHQWMPVAAGDSPVPPSVQRRNAKMGRTLRDGGEVIVVHQRNEVRVALLAAGRVQRSWRVSSATTLGEVQLAEPLGQRLLLVTRAYTDASDEFLVLVLDRRGVARRFSVASADWSETAPLSRFRIRGSGLYQLGSDPGGAFVDRYDLEVR